jgi:hypothetical protein
VSALNGPIDTPDPKTTKPKKKKVERQMKVVSTRLAGAHAGQRQQAPWISASIRIPLSNIYKPIETESETLYPTHHCSMP